MKAILLSAIALSLSQQPCPTIPSKYDGHLKNMYQMKHAWAITGAMDRLVFNPAKLNGWTNDKSDATLFYDSCSAKIAFIHFMDSVSTK